MRNNQGCVSNFNVSGINCLHLLHLESEFSDLSGFTVDER